MGLTMRIELDKESLFALASDTRLDLLKSLRSKRRTVTQLARQLDMDKAGVYRHLEKLESGGFVKKFEDHGFIYYGLTWRARGLISPEDNTTVVVLLSLTVFLSAIAAVLVVTLTGVVNWAGQHDAGLLSVALDPLFLVGMSAILVVTATITSYLALRILYRPKERKKPQKETK